MFLVFRKVRFCSTNKTTNAQRTTMDTVNLSNKLNRRSEYNNLDHLYCHTNTNDSGNYIRSKNSGSDMDMVSVLKEIKQLKAYINLHLDLIQDQSDQLMSKDKMLMILKKENDLLKAKIEKLDRRSKSSNGKRDESPIVDQMIAELPEINAKQDMLKKISSKLLTNCTLKLNALSNSIEDVLDFDMDCPTADPEIDNSSSHQTGDDDGAAAAAFVVSDVTTTNNNNKNSSKNGSIIGTLADGKPISKIVLQRVLVGDVEELAIKTEKYESPVKIKYEKLSPPHLQLHPELSNTSSDKSINSPHFSKDTLKTTDDVAVSANINPLNVKSENVRKSRKAAKKDKSTDDTGGSGKRRRDEKSKTQKKLPSIVEEVPPPTSSSSSPSTTTTTSSTTTSLSLTTTSLSSTTTTTSSSSSSTTTTSSSSTTTSSSITTSASQCNRNSVMTTTELYRTREWQMDEIEALVNKQISDCGEDGLNVDEINLEIPRWCIRESNNGVYSSEGTEDLSDDVFIKRHARLEHAEKKRKKWDVQRIREIRTIERLKRRHCKNEITSSDQTVEGMTSFYPSPENVKFVQVADELPVVAFGEPIHVPPPTEFSLPWHHQYRDNSLPISQIATLSNVDHTTILFRTKKRPTRRATPSQLPKAPSKARSSKRSRR